MSAPEHAERARQWLQEQLDLLGNLRNANPRDPSFKLWRQNTLTVLQRIWQGEQARSERFRRIAFSPSSTRSDFRTTREWYTRGCAEATDFLRELLAEVESVGVPEPAGAQSGPVMSAAAREDDFPVLELPSADAPSSTRGDDSEIVLLDSAGTAAALAPQSAEPVARDTAPPRLPTGSRPPATPSAEPEAAPPTLPSRNAHSRPAPVASAESVPTMPVTQRPVAPTAPATPTAPAADAAPAAPTAPAPAAKTPATPPKPEAGASERRAGPEDRRAAPRRTKTRRAEAKPKLKDMLGLQDLGSAPAESKPAARPPATAPAATPAPPAAATSVPPATTPPAATHAEGDDVEQVTANFLRNSPVLGLQGRPVQRPSDATEFLDPDAVAIATLATELARHVSNEAAREPLRVSLMELAAQIEARTPEWALLRDVVAAAMAHPELARRLMPLVLPWLGRAAA